MSSSTLVRRSVGRRLRRLFLERLEDRSLLATITVTGIGDTIAVDGLVTLREAITAANTNAASGDAPAGDAGLDTINFNIPGSGVHTISPASALPPISDPVFINGYSQPKNDGSGQLASANTNGPGLGINAVPLIELAGSAAIAIGLNITAGSSVVRGLVVNRFANNGIILNSDGNVIAGNFIGTSAAGDAGLGNGLRGVEILDGSNNIIGGTALADRNLISGNNSDGVHIVANGQDITGNQVLGNLIGTDKAGTTAIGNNSGVRLEGVFGHRVSGNLIGGTTAAARNVISGNAGSANIFVANSQVDGNFIQGNFIGTDVTGTVGLAGAGNGVILSTGSFNNTIGGTTAGAGNVISGHPGGGAGVRIDGGSSGNHVEGNRIGTNAAGTAAIPNGVGVLVEGASGNTVGGATAGAGNVISGSSGFFGLGVLVNGGTGNSILGNSIFANSGLGIDLGDHNGVTENDLVPGDPDTGSNNLQNFPVLTSATTTAGVTTITGTLNSTPNSTFHIEFFSNTVADPSLHGEGQTLLKFSGPTDVTTDANGDASFSFSLTTALTTGLFVSSTATLLADTDQNSQTPLVPTDTSEFSADVCSADEFTVVNTNDSGDGSLRQAILNANAHSNALNTGGVPDVITFCILGGGFQTIRPTSALPAIADPVVIDGYTQAGSSPNTAATGFNGALNIELDGTNAGAGSSGLVLHTFFSTIRGLVINRFSGDGITLDPGIANGDNIEGNLIGTDATGTLARGNGGNGVTVLGTNNTIGGTTLAARNVISANAGLGIDALVEGDTGDTISVVIQGNYIGTSAAGTADLGNGGAGIHLLDVAQANIGGSDPLMRNVISGNGGAGVAIEGRSAFSNLVQGNFIGADVTGLAALPNAGDGVNISDSPDNAQRFGFAVLVGGTNPGEGNTIAFNGLDGVDVVAGSSNAILGNSIFSNGGLGIDLANDGVTPNDAGDGDGGANLLQNFPVITNVTSNAGTTTIQGTLNSLPSTDFLSTDFRIEVFASIAAGSSGFGEGQTPLGSVTVTTNASGDATFSLQTATPAGTFFTATATRIDPEVNEPVETSEFSAVFPPVTTTDVAVTKAGPATVIAGQNITYTITVANNGAVDAASVTLTDSIPSGATFGGFVSISQGSAAFSSGTVTANLGTVTSAAPATLVFFVTANASDANGTVISNTATAATTTADSNSGNNSSTVNTTVLNAADLAVTKVGQATVVAGQNITYFVTVANSGPIDAQSVSLTDVIPAGATFAGFVAISQGSGAFSAGTVTASFGTIAVGASAALEFAVTANAADADGTAISNTATATSTTADSNSANNSSTAVTTVSSAADLAVTKTGPATATAGTNLTYTITLTNNAQQAAQNVVLSDSVPLGTTFVSMSQASGPTFTGAFNGATATQSAASLAGGGAATFVLIVKADANNVSGATLVNTASVTTSTNDSNPANNSSAVVTTVNTSADVSVTKSGPATVSAGTNLTYTITVANSGPSNAQSVLLHDTVPANTTFVSATQISGPAFSVTTVQQPTSPPIVTAFNADAATLAAGATATFQFVVRSNSSATGGSTLSNTVTVTATGDSNSENNSASVTTTVVVSPNVSVTKTDRPDPVAPGANLTYTIVVRNSGPSDSSNITLSDVIPAHTTFFDAGTGTDVGSIVLTLPIGGETTFSAQFLEPLTAGATATFTLIVRVDNDVPDGTVISNTATVMQTFEPNEVISSATTTTMVRKVAPLDCIVTTLNSPGASGSAFLRDDADNPGTGALIVTGTSANDIIVIEPRPYDPTQLRVTRNGRLVALFHAADVQHIVAFGLAGNDKIIVNGSLLIPATLFGNAGKDQLFGARGSDALDGGAGDDKLFGNAGNDTLCGGNGNDYVFGEDGNDTVGGDAGNDHLYGSAGNDRLLGGAGNDFLSGGSGDDFLFGQAGNDQLYGDTGSDVVVGGAGNDLLFGSSGRDLLIGGQGADQLYSETDDDILVSGSTTHDEDEAALAAIMAEWTSPNLYATRISHLKSGGGASGGVKLDSASIIDDGLADVLRGDGGADWFLFGSRDKVKDKAIGELN